MADVDQSNMWAQLMQSMQSRLFPGGLGPDMAFSVAAVARSVNLDATDPGFMNYGVYALGDIVPANSPTYNPASNPASVGLVASYSQLLDWIDLGAGGNPTLQSYLNTAINGNGGSTSGLLAIQTAYSSQYTRAVTYYLTHKANAASVGCTIEPFWPWALHNYPVLVEAQNQFYGAQSKVEQLSLQLYGPGYAQIQLARHITSISGGAQEPMRQNGYNMQVAAPAYVPPGSAAAQIGAVAEAGTGTPAGSVSFFVPLYSLDPACTATLAEWQEASTTGRIGETFHFDSHSNDYDYRESGWNASAKANWSSFFWSAGASTSSVQTVNVDASSSDFSVDIAFVGVKAFGITPGSWWQNGSLLSAFKGKLKPGAPDFFSDDGALARRASQVVLGFGPTITVKLSAADYSRLKSSWQSPASFSVGVGPFSFSDAGGPALSKNAIHYDDATSSLKIGPIESTMPVLLGVVSSRL